MDEKYLITPAPVSAPSKNFIGLEEEYAGFKKSKAVIVSVPYDKTTTYVHGAKNGPRAIIDASAYLELYDDELNQETYRIGIHTLPALEVENLPSEDMIKKVHASCAELLKSNKFPVMLGGEHSLSIGAVSALKESYANLSVLQLDAHNDLKNEYFGSRLNHGCVGRRISEMCPLVQAGTRSMSKEEKDFLAAQANGKARAFSVYDILEKPMWKDELVRNLTESVYVTIDLDVFDPSLVPAVGTPEPGGIGWYETLDLLREVAKDKKIVGFDVVELCPIEAQVASDFLAAKLVYRLLGYVFTNKK
ncbi:MAG: agmatinase [Candidatus Omnitrophota bacterium]|nr:agmatinase [Candidatus Omnitrophota bacterium]